MLNTKVKDSRLAQNDLVGANTRLVVSVAKHYADQGPLLDLIQEGNIGLMTAAKKYDPHLGKFSTYAVWSIRSAITGTMADQNSTIRIPTETRQEIQRMRNAASELEQKMRRPPTDGELADKLSVNVEKIVWLRAIPQDTLELDAPLPNNNTTTFGDFVVDTKGLGLERIVFESSRSEMINKILKTLTEREQIIVRLRFGLEDGTVYTLREIGQKVGLSDERISQIVDEIIKRLRHPRRARKLEPYR